MKHSLQVELAQWIERVRQDPTAILPLADWAEENNIPAQQFREAAKLITVAHSSLAFPRTKKFCGIVNYFTKFKIVQIHQTGFRYDIKISSRGRYWTNKRIKITRGYKNLK